MTHTFKVGDRVQLHPATDLWMRGARYGTIEKLGRLYVHVRLDATGRIARVRSFNLEVLA